MVGSTEQPPEPRPGDHRAAVRAWAAHLVAGGSTPWREWGRDGQFHRPGGETAATSDPTGPTTSVPVDQPDLSDAGAAQLEVVRRLAERRTRDGAGGLDDARFAALAARVLATSGPGRGLPHLPVLPLDPATGEPLPLTSTIGARPVDPARVPGEELLRVLTGVIPDLLVQAAPHLQPASGAVAPRRTTKQPIRFTVVGPPAASATVRAALLAAGHREGGPAPRVVVVGLPLEKMLAEAWGIRVARGSSLRWHRFLSRWTADRTLVSVNLPALARHHSAPRHRSLRTRLADAVRRTEHPPPVVVLAPNADELLPRVATALGLPDLEPAPSAPRGLDAEAADLLRRVHRIAVLSLAPEQCDVLTGAAVALLERPGDRPRIGAPGSFHSRIRHMAEQLARELRADADAGRYVVAGDPEVLAARPRIRTAAPDLGTVLDRGLDLVLAAAAALPQERP